MKIVTDENVDSQIVDRLRAYRRRPRHAEQQLAARGIACYTYRITMRFEWDRAKDRFNRKKHGGIAFKSEALVFDDPFVMFRKDRIVDGEQRWHAIGTAVGAVLPVVHAYRLEHEDGEEETVRIISAREANQRERRVYLQQAAE